MTIKAACEHCGKAYRLDERMAGKRAKCKACGQAFTIAPIDETPEYATPEPAAEVFQPAPASRPTRSKPAVSINPKLLTRVIVAVVAVVGIVVLLVLHPWTTETTDTNRPQPPVGNSGSPVASASALPPEAIPSEQLGVFRITPPQGFSLVHRYPDRGASTDQLVSCFVVGYATWTGSSSSGVSCTVDAAVEQRDPDPPIPKLTGTPQPPLAAGSEQPVASLLATHAHESAVINGINFDVLSENGLPLEYIADDHLAAIRVSLKANAPDQSCADLLRKVVQSLSRNASDDEAADKRLTVLSQGGPQKMSANDSLSGLRDVLKHYTETHNGFYPYNVFDVFAAGFSAQMLYTPPDGSVLIMTPRLPRAQSVSPDIVLAHVEDMKSGDETVLFGDGSIRSVSRGDWLETLKKSNALLHLPT